MASEVRERQRLVLVLEPQGRETMTSFVSWLLCAPNGVKTALVGNRRPMGHLPSYPHVYRAELQATTDYTRTVWITLCPRLRHVAGRSGAKQYPGDPM